MIKSNDIIKKEIHKFIYDNFPTEKSPEDDSKIFEEGYVDSVGLLSIIYFIEDTFNVKILDEEVVAENFESIATMSTLIETKMAVAEE